MVLVSGWFRANCKVSIGVGRTGIPKQETWNFADVNAVFIVFVFNYYFATPRMFSRALVARLRKHFLLLLKVHLTIHYLFTFYGVLYLFIGVV